MDQRVKRTQAQTGRGAFDPVPAGIEFSREPAGWMASWRWRKHERSDAFAWLLAVGFIVVPISLIAGGVLSQAGIMGWLGVAIALLLGLALLYWQMAVMLNTTSLRCENGMLSVRTGPLPWLERAIVNARGIVSAYADDSATSEDGDRERPPWRLRLRMPDNRRISVAHGLSKAAATFLAEEVMESVREWRSRVKAM